MGLGLPELLIILVIVFLVFGAGKLPQVMAQLGKGVQSFREGASDAPWGTVQQAASSKTVKVAKAVKGKKAAAKTAVKAAPKAVKASAKKPVKVAAKAKPKAKKASKSRKA